MYSQVLYPIKTINPANGDTVVMFSPEQVFGLTDTITKLVDANNECTLFRKFKDSLLTAANVYIVKQEFTIKKYNDLRPIYESLIVKNDSIEAKYDREVVLIEQKLAIHKKKNVARWVTTVMVILIIGAGAFLTGYFIAK